MIFRPELSIKSGAIYFAMMSVICLAGLPTLLGLAATTSMNIAVGAILSAFAFGFASIIEKLFTSSPLASKAHAFRNKKMTALQLHVKPFAEKELDNGDLAYNGSSIANRLAKAGSVGASIKGPIISGFNSFHSSAKCPFAGGVLPNNKLVAMSLHLGTTRIWDKNGNVDKARFNKFIKACATNHKRLGKIFTPKKVKAYLAECIKKDPQQKDTGRNTLSLFSLKFAQHTAADKAWDEVFNTYNTGVINGEPYLNYNAMHQFFYNTQSLVDAVEARVNTRLSKKTKF